MWVIAIFIAAIFMLATIACYLQRFWYFQDIKGVHGDFPLPIIMNALQVRSTEKLLDYFINIGKNVKGLGCKLTIGLDNYLILLDNEAVNAAFNCKDLVTKGRDYELFVPWLGEGMVTSSGKKHAQRRKLLTPAFNTSILRDFVSIFETNGEVLIDILKQKSNEGPIEVFEIFALYALNVICESTMGVSINAQHNKNHKYVVAARKITDLIVRRQIIPWNRLDFIYKRTSEYKTFTELRDWIHKFSLDVIEDRRQSLTDCNDDLNGTKKKMVLLDVLIKGTIDGMPLSNEDIEEETVTFISAGSDTTTSSLSFILYCLSQHPDIQEKVFKEQMDILGEAAYATYDDLQKMDYLEMVIKETLRLYATGPASTRLVERDISMEFGTLKKGMQVVFSPTALHMKPEYFPDPDRFDPERFSPENIKNIKPCTYIPFSGGFRICVGQAFAMLEMKSAISKIVKHFKILPDVTYKPILVYEIFLRSKNGVRVILENRQ